MKRHRLLWFALAALFAGFAWTTYATPSQVDYPIIQLTDNPANDVRPSWSPDGKQIAFQSNRDSATYHIYLMNADGSNQRALTSGSSDDRHPFFTPDGKTIVYDSSDPALSFQWSERGSQHAARADARITSARDPSRRFRCSSCRS